MLGIHGMETIIALLSGYNLTHDHVSPTHVHEELEEANYSKAHSLRNLKL